MSIIERDAISRDAAAAKAAGLSYGKYKALQYEAGVRTADTTREKVPADVRVCPVCGVLFFPQHGNIRYCSVECRETARVARKHEYYMANK